MRGWSCTQQRIHRVNSVFPAGAGVILCNRTVLIELERFPRRCGGDPISILWCVNVSLFSPQVRGWSFQNFHQNGNFQVFPAGAGVIPIHWRVKFSIWSFPRRCGGDPPTDEIYVIDRASSRNNRGEPCLWHSHKSIRFFQKMGLLFQDISEWCN